MVEDVLLGDDWTNFRLGPFGIFRKNFRAGFCDMAWKIAARGSFSGLYRIKEW